MKRRIISFMLALSLVTSGVSAPQVDAKSKAPKVSKSMTLTIGQSKTIEVKSNGTKVKKKTFKVTTGKGKKVISVSKKGKVKAKKTGSAKVQVTIKYKVDKKLKTKKYYTKIKVTSVKNKVTQKPSNTSNTSITTKPSVTTSTPISEPSETPDDVEPSETPTTKPTETPTTKPTETPTTKPTETPSSTATSSPSNPSSTPTTKPTATPWLNLNKDGIKVEGGVLTSYNGSAESIDIPEGVEEIGEGALEGQEVKSVSLPRTLKTIGAKAFKDCTNLEEVECPESVEEVGDLVWSGCTSLKTLSIPNEDAEIGNSILDGCTRLTSAYIPAVQSNCTHSYMKIKFDATCTAKGKDLSICKDCGNIVDIDVPALGHKWGKVSHKWSKDGKSSCTATRVCKADSSHVETSEAVITSEVVQEATCTEKGYTEYTAEFDSLEFGVAVSRIADIDKKGHNWGEPEYTWSSDGSECTATMVCQNDTSHVETEDATVTSGVKVEPTCTESGTTEYTAKFNKSAFTNQTKDIVDIPATGHSPHDGYCTVCNEKIAGLYDKDGNLLCTWKGSGINVETNYTYDTYKTSTTSPYYVITNNYPSTTKVVIPDGVTSIGIYAFADCLELTSITIPDSVTSIGNGAFDSCSGLTNITIPNSVTSIGSGVFSDCTGLTSITIPDGVTSIGEFAFWFCTGLTSITIPDSVTSIGESAFYYCTGLTSITIPDGVTSIGNYAFYYCSGLTSITIPDGVTSIGNMAFKGCSGLTSVTFKNSTGWYIGDSVGTKTTAISSSDLANTSTAATYLKSTYCYNKYWTRVDE